MSIGEEGSKDILTGQPRARGRGVLARPPQGLDLELCALELADCHLVVRDGVDGPAVAVLPPPRLHAGRRGGGEHGGARGEDAPGGRAEGSVEGVHCVCVCVYMGVEMVMSIFLLPQDVLYGCIERLFDDGRRLLAVRREQKNC